MRIRFVTHGHDPMYRYAAMPECPRRGEFINLEDGLRWYVKWVRWEPPLEGEPAMRMLDRPPTSDDLHFDASVELEKGMPDGS